MTAGDKVEVELEDITDVTATDLADAEDTAGDNIKADTGSELDITDVEEAAGDEVNIDV